MNMIKENTVNDLEAITGGTYMRVAEVLKLAGCPKCGNKTHAMILSVDMSDRSVTFRCLDCGKIYVKWF
jgi:predicted RNA-binding Zn-ribbon protein involved in translation (DUF1610 family)